MKRLIVFGSSHTVGYGLKDHQKTDIDRLSSYAWPSLIADHYKIPVVSYAKCANPMDQIHLDVMDYILNQRRRDDFIILQVPASMHWFTLLHDKRRDNIISPETLLHDRKKQKHLKYFYGVLTNDDHWRRIWTGYFLSISLLLKDSNWIYFFDRHPYHILRGSEEYYDAIANRDINLYKTLNLSNCFPYNIIDWIKEQSPKYIRRDGHATEKGHAAWAKFLIDKLDDR